MTLTPFGSMARIPRLLVLLASLCIAPLCAGQPAAPAGRVAGPSAATATTNRAIVQQARRTFAIEATGVYTSNEFDGARLNDFFQTGASAYTALITPENVPVNDAAWYAFKLSSKSNQTIELKLSYQGGKHRYLPKISRDGRDWERLDAARYRRDEADHSATLQLEIGPQPIYVSAQELFTSTDFERWIAQVSGKRFVRSAVIGRSFRGKPIHKLEITEAGDDAQYVLVLGRQHPPEVTGTLALLSFIDTICADTPLAKGFRKLFNVIVVPLVNPDGVDAGHWRHNANGVDLNRDWGQFNQPETRVVRDEFLRVQRIAPGKIRFGLDFHSTRYDVFYPVMIGSPEAQNGNDAFLRTWLDDIQRRLPAYKVNIEESRSKDAGMTLFSTAWMTRELKIPSVTFELGDETDRELIWQLAAAAANAMMELLSGDR